MPVEFTCRVEDLLSIAPCIKRLLFTKAAKFIHGCDSRIKRYNAEDNQRREAAVSQRTNERASYNDFDSRILVAQAS